MTGTPKKPVPSGFGALARQLGASLPLVGAGIGLYIIDTLLGTGVALTVLAAGAALYIYNRRPTVGGRRPDERRPLHGNSGPGARTIISGPTP